MKQTEELVEELYSINEYGFRYQNPDISPDPSLVQIYKEKYGIRTDVHRTCVNCQIRQLKKYEETTGDAFRIKCNFIPRGLPPGSKSKLTQIATATDIPVDRAKKLLLSTIDPVAWAELMFGFDDSDEKWKIRSYQKEQIRCSARRLAVREGRRSGKTFAMALKLLHFAFNLKVSRGKDSEGKEVIKGPDIMIVTPYQAQLTNIFEEIERLLKRNYELKLQVTTGTNDNLYIKTPTFKMAFKNGCVIQGFVSGLGAKQDGSGGGTMRGQSAHIVYLDEMDMIPEDILDKVINPILATSPETILIATSTPIGKRGKFYQWCLARNDFKEDYYPSTVLPHWDEIKGEIEEESTKESFEAEYMAEFIEGSYGVFRPSWIQSARSDYEYMASREEVFTSKKLGVRNTSEMLIAIGIDWNKNAGTEFYVLGYSATLGKWIGLEAVNVESSEFSSQRWMKEVIRLNYKWKPDWIYADEGYGHTTIEDLKLLSYKTRSKTNKTKIDEATIRLTEILVPFNFSKNVILKDPITGKDIKKTGKHYLVENAVKTLEDNLFMFPHSDERLKKQLGNYIILRKHATTGKPVYGMSNKKIGDHRLDAFMLALAALSLEESIYSGKGMSFSSPSYINQRLGAASQDTNPSSPHTEATEIAEGLKKHSMPGAYNILKILRGESPAGKIKAEIDNKKRKRSSFSPQGVENKKEPGILRGLEQNLGTPRSSNLIGGPSHLPAIRGGKSRRSRTWRK